LMVLPPYLSPPVPRWIHISRSAESRLPLDHGSEVHLPGRGLHASLILLHKFWCSTAIVVAWVCVAWIFQVCCTAARCPAKCFLVEVYERGHLVVQVSA
jgi:hypothetical protein